MEQDNFVKVRFETVGASAPAKNICRSPVVMLLEDEPLISMDVESVLRDAGFDVINFMSCEDAHAWLADRLPDFAIVDIELRDGPCSEVVSRLTRANVPFAVHSGDHPSVHIGTPFAKGIWIGKPAPSECLLDVARVSTSHGHLNHPTC